MSRVARFDHEFVEFIPEDPLPGVIYVSITYATSVHRCACGCGLKVATPLSPTDWKLTFDGETISLNPSIGSWSFPCGSHYVIRRNRVRWARPWSKERIEAGRARTRRRSTTAAPLETGAMGPGTTRRQVSGDDAPANSCGTCSAAGVRNARRRHRMRHTARVKRVAGLPTGLTARRSRKSG